MKANREPWSGYGGNDTHAIVYMHEKQGFVDSSRMTPGFCTLDGRPAVVCGFRERFAHVARITTDAPHSVEYSWHAVKHVIEHRNGAFKS